MVISACQPMMLYIFVTFHETISKRFSSFRADTSIWQGLHYLQCSIGPNSGSTVGKHLRCGSSVLHIVPDFCKFKFHENTSNGFQVSEWIQFCDEKMGGPMDRPWQKQCLPYNVFPPCRGGGGAGGRHNYQQILLLNKSTGAWNYFFPFLSNSGLVFKFQKLYGH